MSQWNWPFWVLIRIFIFTCSLCLFLQLELECVSGWASWYPTLQRRSNAQEAGSHSNLQRCPGRDTSHNTYRPANWVIYKIHASHETKHLQCSHMEIFELQVHLCKRIKLGGYRTLAWPASWQKSCVSPPASPSECKRSLVAYHGSDFTGENNENVCQWCHSLNYYEL